MKKFLIILALSVLMIPSVEALLPPFYESLAEYKALLNNKELEENLGSGQWIEEITRNEKGFMIKTPKYVMHIDVVYKNTGKIGPAEFELKFHPVEERQ